MTMPESPTVILNGSSVRRALPTDTPGNPPQQIPAIVLELQIRTHQNLQEPQPVYVIATIEVAESLVEQLRDGIEDCRKWIEE